MAEDTLTTPTMNTMKNKSVTITIKQENASQCHTTKGRKQVFQNGMINMVNKSDYFNNNVLI